MKPVTAWYRWDHIAGGFEYNHFEAGHTTAVKPSLPQFAMTKPNVWEKYDRWLTDDYPTPKLVMYGPDDVAASGTN